VQILSKCAIAIGLCLLSEEARGQGSLPVPDRDSETRRAVSVDASAPHFSLTVKGGVSLGSYQAGQVWTMLRILGREATPTNPDRNGEPSTCNPTSTCGERQRATEFPRTLDVVTGASAGNVNAVLAALSWCTGKLSNDPLQGPFWRIWTSIGMTGLLQKSRSGGAGLLSRFPLEQAWDSVSLLLQERATRDCDIPVGLSVTGLSPISVRENSTGQVARANRATVAFRIVGRKNFKLSFLQPSRRHLSQPEVFGMIALVGDTLDANHEQVIPPEHVRDAIFASAAFPVAWDAVRLDYCLGADLAASIDPKAALNNASASPQCSKFRPTTRVYAGMFVDGGVFANQPIELAIALDSADLPGLRRQWSKEVTHRDSSSVNASRSLLQSLAAARPNSGMAACMAELRDRLRRADDRMRLSAGDTSRQTTFIPIDTVIPSSCDEIADQSLFAQETVKTIATALATPPPPKVERKTIAALMSDARVSTSAPTVDEPGVPLAPSAALGRLAGGLFTTASEIELSTFYGKRLSSQRETDVRDGVAIRLFASRRFQRLGSEPLHHFGGFLARSLREHDFFAGVADVLSSWIDEFPCEGLRDGAAQSCRKRYGESFLTDTTFAIFPCYGLQIVRQRLAPDGSDNASIVEPKCASELDSLKLRSYTALSASLVALDHLPMLCPFSLSAGIVCDGNVLRLGVDWARRLGITRVSQKDRVKEAFGVMNSACQDRETLTKFAKDVEACVLAIYGARVVDSVGQALSRRLRYVEGKYEGPMRIVGQAVGYGWQVPTRSHGWGFRLGSSLPAKNASWWLNTILNALPSTLDLYSPRIGGMNDYRSNSSEQISLRSAYPAIGWRMAFSTAGTDIENWQRGPKWQLVIPAEIGVLRARGGRESSVLTESLVGFGLAKISRGGSSAAEVLVHGCVGGSMPSATGCVTPVTLTLGFRPLGGLVRLGVRGGLVNQPSGLRLRGLSVSVGFGDFIGLMRETVLSF